MLGNKFELIYLFLELWKLKLIMFKNGIIPFKKHFRITGEDRKTEFTVEYSSADLYDFLQGNRDFFYCNIESTDLIEVNKKFLVSSFIANVNSFFLIKI